LVIFFKDKMLEFMKAHRLARNVPNSLYWLGIVSLTHLPLAGQTPAGGIADARERRAGFYERTEPRPIAAVDSSYRSQAGDSVSVTVFDEPELEVTARIDENGRVQCPLIGQIEVKGLTASEAGERIAAAYRDGYLVNPEVRVVVSGLAAEKAFTRTITIMGQVASPGVRELPGDKETTLLQALGLAGGPTRMARLSKVQLKRKENGRETSTVVDVADILAGKRPDNVIVKEGDVIMVPESWF
jgi:polysaccharide biosynthesis/export protein